MLTSSGEIDGEEVPALLMEGGFKFGLGGNGEVGLLKLLEDPILSLGGTGKGPGGFWHTLLVVCMSW